MNVEQNGRQNRRQENRRPVQLLLVEDDDVDAMAVRRALNKHRIANPVLRAHDGVEALEMLHRDITQPPVIVLLDLNMPRMNGLEFLDQLRADPVWSSVVVFVLTTSAAESDIDAAYRRHVAGYIVKKNAGADFVEAIRMLEHYWCVVELPDENGAATAR
ncbi:MAG: response regulator [Wenzhouxiangellaceae bacterium]|nr:response regulator [Wenzhouxiangellaceae bacterium]